MRPKSSKVVKQKKGLTKIARARGTSRNHLEGVKFTMHWMVHIEARGSVEELAKERERYSLFKDHVISTELGIE